MLGRGGTEVVERESGSMRLRVVAEKHKKHNKKREGQRQSCKPSSRVTRGREHGSESGAERRTRQHSGGNARAPWLLSCSPRDHAPLIRPVGSDPAPREPAQPLSVALRDALESQWSHSHAWLAQLIHCGPCRTALRPSLVVAAAWRGFLGRCLTLARVQRRSIARGAQRHTQREKHPR